jgi:hypothetical protein
MFNEMFWIIYLSMIFNNVGCVLTITGIFGLIFAAIMSLGMWINYDQNDYKGEEHLVLLMTKWTKWIRRFAITGIAFLCVAMLLPSQKVLLAMFAGGVAQEIVQSEKAHQVGNKAFDVLNTWLDEQSKQKKN